MADPKLSDDSMGTPPDVDVDSAGRGQSSLDGMPGINVVRSIGQDEYMTYSDKTDFRDSGGRYSGT